MHAYLDKSRDEIRAARLAWARDLREYDAKPRAIGALCDVGPDGEERYCATGIGIARVMTERGSWRVTGRVPMEAVEALRLDEPVRRWSGAFANARTLGALVMRMNDTGVPFSKIAYCIEYHAQLEEPVMEDTVPTDEFDAATADVSESNKALRDACSDYARCRLIEQRFDQLLAVYEGPHYAALIAARKEVVAASDRKRRVLDDCRHAADRARDKQDAARRAVERKKLMGRGI